ncbi:unnamed protein product [Caenorhabditis auriculariae]|uniref:EGF-like domain-containing protein n=1 Tax=Caenorhabditis auriculariae TaxID=2777116 RepID=A0A8S1GV19_9PELO|nr:unnamed protein product [Caenorhabditis auriculariae]
MRKLLAGVLLSVFFASFGADGRCVGTDCDMFECTSDAFVLRPMDAYLRTGSTFGSPCACAADWNSVFCNQSSSGSSSSFEEPHPTICICRKFSDNGSKCDQFMSRCFARKNHECSCCFNQPKAYCNHLRCKHNEPDFSGANTTCVCYHSPTNYPYQICKALYPHENALQSRKTVLFARNQNVPSTAEQHIELFGRKVSTSTLTYVVVSMLGLTCLMTLGMLIMGGQRIRRRRQELLRQTRVARETLIMQRADDDRYLPSA